MIKQTVRFFFGIAVFLLGFTASVALDMEELVVLGTRGEARSSLDSAVPVDVITSESLEQVSSFGGELGEVLLALAPSFNFPRQSNSGSADHVRAGQLRGLSPDQILVLVNGKRQHTVSVVNLEAKIGLGTTPFDFNTIPLIAIERIEILRDGAGAMYGSDAIAGVINIVMKDAPEGGSLQASYGAHRTDFDPTGTTISDGHTVEISGDYGLGIGQDGFFRFGASYRNRKQTNRAGIGALPFFENQTPPNLALDPARVFAPGDGETDDIQVFYNAGVPVGWGEFYSFGRYAYRDAQGAAFFRYPDGFSGVLSVYPNGYRPVTTGENNDISLTNGLRGASGNWDWDVSLVVGQNNYEFGVDNSINPSFGAASPLSFNLAEFEFTQSVFDVDVKRDFDVNAFAGPLTLAFGTELRFEDYETTAGDPESYLAGPLAATKAVGAEAGPGLDINSTVDTDRFVIGAYIDLEAEVVNNLTLGVAARYEDYDDFGDSLNGKLKAIYRFNDAFAIRGSYGTNFRAPSLAQTGFEFSTQNFGAGGMLVVFGHLPVSDPVAIANGATELQEEESTNLNAGLMLSLGKFADITADFFRIDIDDRITLTQGSIDNVTFFTNLVDTKTEGFDVVATGAVEVGSGAINWQVLYSYAETDVKNPSVIGEEELNTLESAAPEDKFILSGNWNVGRWSLLARATRFGETTRDFDFGGGFPDPQTFDAVWSLDVEVAAEVLDKWTVAIGARNLLDEYPDLSSDDNNFFGHLSYDVLSPIGMNGAFYYLRTKVGF